MKNKLDLTIWHRLGIYIGLLMICVGFLMFLPTLASKKIDREHYARTQGSPIWLEHDNNVRRANYFWECNKMPPLPGDIEKLTCAGEAASLFPNRNWKQIAEDNMKKDH